ncbi:hypothetical protein [Lacticaseibacillus camelliae]|uniref:hypothetical protein n=1 Tax=Lacticaseibacillus camelliae TaxID=381742 RepID=UPI000AA4FB0F|nr:hypothetical protein [Lacticaseibacillus camelliae]
MPVSDIERALSPQMGLPNDLMLKLMHQHIEQVAEHARVRKEAKDSKKASK